MLDCISVENMRESDRRTIEGFVPSLELMGRAAKGVFRAADWKGRAAILTGSGNNGGDGFALACILHARGISCQVFTLSGRLSPDSGFYAQKAREAGVPVRPFLPGQDCLKGYDTIVDCLLGTGFQGALREGYPAAIREINAAGGYVVSVDINSGMNGDTGEAQLAVDSQLTVAIGYVKNGMVTQAAGVHMKRLVCAPIGIRLAREENKICDAREWRALCAANGLGPRHGPAELAGKVYYPCPPWLDMTPVGGEEDACPAP